jgi:hypothetical protein
LLAIKPSRAAGTLTIRSTHCGSVVVGDHGSTTSPPTRHRTSNISEGKDDDDGYRRLGHVRRRDRLGGLIHEYQQVT